MKLVAWVVALVTLLVGLGWLLTAEGLGALLFGWWGFLARVLPKVEVNRESAVVGAIALGLFFAGVHWLGRGAYRSIRGVGAAPRAWRFRWTAALVTLVVIAFAAGTAMIGVVHQASWLARSEKPLLREIVVGGDSERQMRDMMYSVDNYKSVNERYPARATLNGQGEELHGWEVLCLPIYYYARYDREKPWNDAVNQKYFKCIIREFLNPELHDAPFEDDEGYGLNHYSANSRVFKGGDGMAVKDITDGAANTILLGEVSDGFSPWGQPGNVRDPANGVTRGVDEFGGPSLRGGTAFGMADGSVRMIADDVDPEVLRALATPDGGE